MEAVTELTASYMIAMGDLQLHRGLEAVMAFVAVANGYFADAAPWGLKDNPSRRASILAATLDATRRIAILAQPAIPEAAGRLLDQLGVARRRARLRFARHRRSRRNCTARTSGCLSALG